MTIVISPKRVTQGLILLVLLFALAGIGVQTAKHVFGHDHLLGFARVFNLDQEANLPTWYQTCALLFCSVLLAIIARHEKSKGSRFACHWSALAFIFMFLSIDEAAAIHEMTMVPLRSALNVRGVLYFAWVIPGALLVLVVALAYARFLLHLPRGTRNHFLIAGVLYVGGALGLELPGGWYAEAYGKRSVPYAMLSTLEEILEMVGILVFTYALLSFLRSHGVSVQVQFEDPRPA